MPVSRFVGTPGEKLSDLKLTITKVRIEDDSYKTQIIRGTEYFYVDQLLTAVDIAGNYFLLRIKAKDRSLTTQTLPPGCLLYTSSGRYGENADRGFQRRGSLRY